MSRPTLPFTAYKSDFKLLRQPNGRTDTEGGVHTIASLNLLIEQTNFAFYSIQIGPETPGYNASLNSNWTELELSLAIWLEKCKCLLTSLLCLTVYFQPNNTGFDTVGNNLGPSTCCLQHSKPRKIDMESQNTTFPQHERSEAERVRGPERTR